MRLTPEAEDDLRDLLQYTLETWGKQQRDTYRKLFSEAFRKLARYPGMGRGRNEISQSLRSYPVGSHVIFYSVTEAADGIVVHRIFHGSRSADDMVPGPGS